MRQGNVIKCPSGNLWIVSDVHDTTVEAISFDSENCSAVQRLDDHTRQQTCSCGDNEYDQGEPQTDCEDCHGSGRYLKRIKGWKHSRVLALTVQEFIRKRALKAFEV